MQPTERKSRSFGWRLWIVLAGCGVLAIILLTVFNSLTPDHETANKVLPDVMGRIKLDGGTERINNTKDEYDRLVRQYGYPDSILSTENDTGADKPIVPTRIARYDAAHVKIAFVPIGCVDAYLKAATIVNDASRYPALAQEGIKRMRAHPCTLSASGWTIMGYIDASDNTAMSADLAGIFLEKIKEKRTTKPIEDQGGKNVAGKTKTRKKRHE